MKPCNCIDEFKCKQLKECGLTLNSTTIEVKNGNVEIKLNNTCSVTMQVKDMKKLAEWFITDQG